MYDSLYLKCSQFKETENRLVVARDWGKEEIFRNKIVVMVIHLNVLNVTNRKLYVKCILPQFKKSKHM